MRSNSKQNLTLDQTATYQITVPGELNLSWSEWIEGLSLSFENKQDSLPITTLTGALDQAALQGLLRRLYAQGIPLLSVICLDFVECAEEETDETT